MLLVRDKLMKLGGITISGQILTIDISEAAIIEDIEDDKGNVKANQPTGYEAAKVSIEFVIEKYKGRSEEEQIAELQRLFHPAGRKKAKLIRVVNEDCAARGISKVYINSFSTQNVIEKSGRVCTLELLSPVTGTVKVIKKKAGKKNIPKKKKPIRTKTIKNVTRSPAMVKRNIRPMQSKLRVMIN